MYGGSFRELFFHGPAVIDTMTVCSTQQFLPVLSYKFVIYLLFTNYALSAFFRHVIFSTTLTTTVLQCIAAKEKLFYGS